MRVFILWTLALIITGLTLNVCYGGETRDDTALLLARTCVAEIGFEGTVKECELMWSINQKNAIKKRRSIEKQTLLFNSYWKAKIQRRRRPWIKYLEGPEKPKHWPASMDWQMFTMSWQDIETAAHAFASGKRQQFHGCPDAMDYGAPGETPQMRRVEKIKCLDGNTRQRYWRFKK